MSLVRLFVATCLTLALANLATAQPLLPPRTAVAEPQQPPQPLAQPPFQIDRQQEANLDLLLRNWQQTSGQVNTFSCTFTLFEYNAVFGDADKPMRVEQGEIRYVRPDKGLYHVKAQGGEHWICDGRAIYEFRSARKELIESRLPQELWGKAIADGPLPFVFGVDAGKLKQRYWMRITTPQQAKGEVWLEAFPRTRQDAANFKKVDIILTNPGLEPFALQMYEPQGKVRKVYQFADRSINGSMHKLQEFVGGFIAPQTPLGWRHIIQDAPVAPQPPSGNPTVSNPPNPAQTQAGRQPRTR